ncbi:MAG: hypothetical protein J2O49_00145 [Sciscionella sp.]|nr:hypothetical protein [Sciscionella sp.]
MLCVFERYYADRDIASVIQWQQAYDDTFEEKTEYDTMDQIVPLAPDQFSQQHYQATKEFIARGKTRHAGILKYMAGWVEKMYATAQSYGLTDELSASDLTKIKHTLQVEGISVPGDKA